MKRKVLLSLASATLLCACGASQQKMSVNGTLTGLTNDTLLIMSASIAETNPANVKTDTVVMNNGQFTFELSDTIAHDVSILSGGSGEDAASLSLVLFPGESVQLSGSMFDYQIQGSPFNEELLAVQNSMKPYRANVDSLSVVAMDKMKNGADREELQKFYEEVYAPAIEELKDNYVQYVREHPDSHVSLALLGMCDVEDVKELLPTLTDEVANGPLAVRYQAMSDALQQMQAREEAQKKVAEGNVAPDFTLKDLQGKDLSLSSLRGKYVVLDFWGSWCGWCIKGIPEMKKYYAKYKDRMEILGIDCRDTEEAWKAAVEKHELPWLHVRNDGEPDVTVMYAIQGFPTKIVIDPDGKIAKVVVGEDPAFYEYLDSLFK